MECLALVCRIILSTVRLVTAVWYMLERDDHRAYTHESALTRRMWYSTVTPTAPDTRRVSWGQSAQTTTREVSFALTLVDTHGLRRVLNNTEVKERNLHIVQYNSCSLHCKREWLKWLKLLARKLMRILLQCM